MKSNYYISNLYKISNNCKTLQEEHMEILHNLTQKDSNINDMLEFYSDYLRKNKNFLIRNQILKTFIERISITKEEKDNLIDKTKFDDKFFLLIDKIVSIKMNIQIIEKNNENFSKNLLFSMKENTVLIEELMNEKIFIFLKTIFRTSKTTSVTDLNNIKKALSFIYKKENYLNYVLKEYTQIRKKILDDHLKKNYLSINNREEIIFKIINEFKYHFFKEIVLLHFFFGSQKNSNVDLYMVLQMYNNNNLELDKNKYESSIATFKEIFKNEKLDFTSFINLLNVILFSFEQITYENFKKASNIPTTPDNLSKFYNITLMSYLYSHYIEKFSKELNISSIDNLSLYGFLINNKKSISKTLAKCFSDFSKAVLNLKGNFKKFISSNELFLNENNSNKMLLMFYDEFSIILKTYHYYCHEFSEKDRENLNPKLSNQCFKTLFEFFDGLDLFKENNLQVICRVINLTDNIVLKFKIFENFDLIQDEMSKLNQFMSNSIRSLVDLIHSFICKQTNFNEENLNKITTYEQMINLIEYILDKSQFYFQNLNIFSNSSLKDKIRDDTKESLLSVYKEFLDKKKTENSQFKPILAEEEFKNYIDIL